MTVFYLMVIVTFSFHGPVLGREIFRHHILEWPYATQPPVGERLVECGDESKSEGGKSKGNAKKHRAETRWHS